MPHFLVKQNEIKDDFIELSESDTLFHIFNVRRAKKGEKIKFIDENKVLFECQIEEISKKSLTARILSKTNSERFLKQKISLIQSVLAPDAQNLLIANATQTGVQKIYPVISDNVSVKIKDGAQKVEKWQKIVSENFKQCERADFALVEEILPLKEVLQKFEHKNILIFAEKDCNIELDDALKDINTSNELGVVIGPEGGFSQAEFDFFAYENYKLISLGKLIYKAPNAVVAAISNIVSRIEK